MRDHTTTIKQLMDELDVMRRRVRELEKDAAHTNKEKSTIQLNAQLSAIIKAFDGLIYVCSQDYRIEFMNERLVERTGYDATGELCYNVLHDRDSICPWCVNDRIFEGETVRWELQSPKDSRWYYIVNTPLYNADGTISKQAMILDITERKCADDALLRKSEEKYRELVENANSIIFRRDIVGTVTFFNEFAQQFFGYREEEILGKNVIGTIVPEVESTGRDLKKMIEAIGMNPDQYVNNINENMLRSGERVWIAWTNKPIRDESGRVTEILCIGNNITDRKQTEAALLKTEREKSAILDAMSELVILLDTNMHVIWSNSAVNRQFNLQPGQLEGKYCYAALHGLKMPCRICPVAKVIETGKSCTINEFSSLGKSWTLRAYPVFNEEGNLTGIVEIVTDITKRKQAEEALRQAFLDLQELNFIVNKSPAIAFLWRASDTWPVEFVSENITQFGYMPDDLTSGKIPYSSIVHPNDLKRVVAEVVQYTQEDRTEFTQEYRILTKSGQVRWIDDRTWVRRNVEGHVTHYQGIVFDITERKKAEEELRRVNNIQSLILDNSVMGICFVRNRVFEWVNPRLPEMLGLPMNKVCGSHTRIIYPSDELYEETGRRAYSALNKGEWFEFEIAMPRSDGTTFMGRVLGKALDPSLPQEGSIWIFEDITERIRLESQLLQSQKMKAIGTLAGGIAHDFNNILAAIIGYAEMTKARLKQPEIHRFLDQILKASDRARNLVTQILTFSRQEEREKKPVDMSLLIQESLKLLRATIPSTIKINAKVASEVRAVLADSTQIHQIMMNLCANAAHAMREKGGLLEVGLNNEEITPEMSPLYPDLKPGPHVKVTVRDTGTGVTPAIMDRIFDPFFTTKERGEGSGLGLSVVYGIVKEYGGTVTVKSEPGAGSTFTIYLPAVEHEAEEKAEPSDTIRGGSERILFVDDETILADVGREMLEGIGYEVVAVTSSTSALEIFHTQPDRFDLVITDMTMPVMTGKDLIEELLRIRPNIPTILCTGFSEFITDKEAKGLGISDFLMKPISLKNLAKSIRSVLDARDV